MEGWKGWSLANGKRRNILKKLGEKKILASYFVIKHFSPSDKCEQQLRVHALSSLFERPKRCSSVCRLSHKMNNSVY